MFSTDQHIPDFVVSPRGQRESSVLLFYLEGNLKGQATFLKGAELGEAKVSRSGESRRAVAILPGSATL